MYELKLTKEELDVLSYVVGNDEIKEFVGNSVPADKFGMFDVLDNIEKKIKALKEEK